MTDPTSSPESQHGTRDPNRKSRELPGRWVVTGIVMFAVLMTAGLWVFWKLHVGPFLPLQQALAEQFPDSRPHVEGGQRKIDEGTPRILRVTMKVEFDPERKDAQARSFADAVATFVRHNHDLTPYERLELHLYQLRPEKTIRRRAFEMPVAELPRVH